MERVAALTEMINTKVYYDSGRQAGTIDELIVDPAAGIVRFASIKTDQETAILMPWAALLFTKAKGGFVLTDKGESIVRSSKRR